MDKAVVTLLIRSFRGGQAAIAHYLYVLSYNIIAVTGGGFFLLSVFTGLVQFGRWSLFVMYKIYEIQISNLYQHKHIDNLHKTTIVFLSGF